MTTEIGRHRLRDRYAIVGVGQSAIGEVPGSTSLGLLADAMRAAVADAGLRPGDIDGIVSRGPDDAYTHHQQMGRLLGLDVPFSTSLDNGGASQILSVVLAVMAIDAGLCTTVLCGFGRNSWTRTHASEEKRQAMDLVPSEQRAGQFSREFGLFGAPAMHAFGARRHMCRYGTTKEQLGHIAVTFREHALRNPHAQMRQPLSMEDYLAGRVIVDPFNVFDCSLVTDGAGAVVVTSAERARDLARKPVLIRGFGTFNNLSGWFEDEHMVETAASKSAQTAYRMAGVGPSDIDTAEIYDCFTYMVLTQLEDYGFCKKGEGGAFVSSGALALGGSLPTNTAGGQLSEGHLEGMLQIVEAARQVRQEHAPERQVANAEVALVSGHGGSTVCHSSLILGRA